MTEPPFTGSLAGTERLAREPLILLFLALFATAAGQAFVFAILPPLGRSVGLDEIRITAIISTSALVFTLVAPFWGRFLGPGGPQARHCDWIDGLLHRLTLIRRAVLTLQDKA